MGIRDDEDNKTRQRLLAVKSLRSPRTVRSFRKLVDLRRDPLPRAQAAILKQRYRETIQNPRSDRFLWLMVHHRPYDDTEDLGSWNVTVTCLVLC